MKSADLVIKCDFSNLGLIINWCCIVSLTKLVVHSVVLSINKSILVSQSWWMNKNNIIGRQNEVWLISCKDIPFVILLIYGYYQKHPRLSERTPETTITRLIKQAGQMDQFVICKCLLPPSQNISKNESKKIDVFG
jgi:hypothetical protein